MTLEERAEEYIEKNSKMWEEGELTVDEIVRLTYKDCAKENGKLLQRITQLEKDVTENESDCSICDFPKLKQDLEKANTKLQQACHKWFMRWREAKKDALYFDSGLQNQIQATLELQKENAELKEEVDKATELIGDMYDKIPASHSDYYKDVMERAEQFIKEFEIREDRLCEYCDQYKSFPDGKRCRTCDNGSKWKRRIDK